MFVNVETFLLDALVNTQTVQLLDAEEQGDTTGGSPEVDDEDTEALGSEKSPSTSIESTVAGREQTCHQSTENTTDTVYRAGTHRVVDMQLVVDELDGIDQYDTTDKTNDDGSNRRYEVTASRDAYQSCQHTVQGQ